VDFVKKHASPGKLETEINGKAVEFYLVGSDDKELKSVKAEVEQKFKGKIADTKIQNEETIHEAVTGHFDVSDPKEMKKSLAKFRLKGKISQKHVNAGYDEWEVSGKSIEDIWAWYHKSGYGDKDDFDDMDDFKDTHFESREHHRAMMTEGKGPKKGYFRMPNGDDVWVANNPSVLPRKWAKKVEAGKIDATKMDWSGKPATWKEENEITEGSKEEYQKFFQAALKKFGAKSPAEMDDEKKKKFFNYIDKNWTKEE